MLYVKLSHPALVAEALKLTQDGELIDLSAHYIFQDQLQFYVSEDDWSRYIEVLREDGVSAYHQVLVSFPDVSELPVSTLNELTQIDTSLSQHHPSLIDLAVDAELRRNLYLTDVESLGSLGAQIIKFYGGSLLLGVLLILIGLLWKIKRKKEVFQQNLELLVELTKVLLTEKLPRYIEDFSQKCKEMTVDYAKEELQYCKENKLMALTVGIFILILRLFKKCCSSCLKKGVIKSGVLDFMDKELATSYKNAYEAEIILTKQKKALIQKFYMVTVVKNLNQNSKEEEKNHLWCGMTTTPRQS